MQPHPRPPRSKRGAPSGVAHPRAIFSARHIRIIRKLSARGWNSVEIAEYMTEQLVRRGWRTHAEPPIHRGTIGKVLRGERYGPR